MPVSLQVCVIVVWTPGVAVDAVGSADMVEMVVAVGAVGGDPGVLRISCKADDFVLWLGLMTCALRVARVVGRAGVLAAGVERALTIVAVPASLVPGSAAEGGCLGRLG